MSTTFTKADCDFLKTVGIDPALTLEEYLWVLATTPTTPSENSPVFSPSDMAQRAKRLKAEGRIPPLSEVLKLIQKQM